MILTHQRWRDLMLSLIVACAGCQLQSGPAATAGSGPTPAVRSIRYQIHNLSRATVYTLLIPAEAEFSVSPALHPKTASLEEFVQQHQAIAAINGGFFDPQNQQSTSYVMLQGQSVADPIQNPRLVDNPDLAPYLNQILNRSEFRRYQCERLRYAIAQHHEATPTGCRLLDALGAGPQLLPQLTAEQEGFTATDANGNLIRDAIGIGQPNARSAVGLTADGSILWVMVAQKPEVAPSGLTLPELAAFMKQQGAETALNLDGGSSSALFYEQQVIHGKLDDRAKFVQRPVKSVLLLTRKPADS